MHLAQVHGHAFQAQAGTCMGSRPRPKWLIVGVVSLPGIQWTSKLLFTVYEVLLTERAIGWCGARRAVDPTTTIDPDLDLGCLAMF